MEENNIDKAFEWLIVVVGIITAIINQYPEYFYRVTPNPDRPFSLRVAIGFVPTMVTITMIWLIGKLSSRSRVQVLSKVIAWMFLIAATWMNLILYVMGVMIGFGTPGETIAQIVPLGLLGFFILCPIISYYVIIPKYRNIYPDVSLLKRKTRLLFLITVAHILLWILVISTH